MAAQVVLVHLVQVRVLTGLPFPAGNERQDARISASDRHETNFFGKNVRFELDFSGMSARLNNMPDAGVAQW